MLLIVVDWSLFVPNEEKFGTEYFKVSCYFAHFF